MNWVSVRRSIANTATIVAPLQVIVEGPGAFLLGLQLWTQELQDVPANPMGSILLRILEGSTRLFPEASANIRTPVTEAVEGGWFTIVGTNFLPTRIALHADPRYRMLLEFANTSGNARLVVVNLLVAANPPDAVTLTLLEQMNQGIERIPSIVSSAMKEALQAYTQTLPFPR